MGQTSIYIYISYIIPILKKVVWNWTCTIIFSREQNAAAIAWLTTNIVAIIGVHIYYYTQQIRNITGVHLSYSINFTVFPNKIFKE